MLAYLCHFRVNLIIIFQEPQVLIRHIHIRIATQPPMFLLSLLTPTEPMLIDLILDLTGSVRHIDRGIGVAGAHLRLRALQRREELGVDE